MNDLMTKSFTNYVDLKKEAMKDLEAGNADLEMTEKQIDPKLKLFLEEAEKVNEEMGEIRVLLVRLQEANEHVKSLHKLEALKALRNGINMDITTVLKKARAIKTLIERMNADNNNKNTNTLNDRARMSVTNGLQKKLKELMMDFQGLRQKMMAEHREVVGRRYFTVTGEENPDEEAIEKIISNGGESGGEDFLHKAKQELGREKVLETVVEIQDRHSAAIEIEKSLLELHQVFLDMAVMVETQGGQLDDIHHHVIVMHTAHYVKDGHTELKTAKGGHQRSSRRCMCLGMTLLLILILLVVTPDY